MTSHRCGCRSNSGLGKYRMQFCPLHSAAADLLESLKWILPLAEAYLRSAPSSPDNAKLESARAAIVKAEAP